MDFGLSRRERVVSTKKTRTHSTILNETEDILASIDQPGNQPCFSSPNSTNMADMNFTEINSANHHANISDQKIDNTNKSFNRIDEVIEARINKNEAYLAQLKSIDLKKYSFPNETKPKTDYTYAKTTSYVSSSSTQDCPMPNLCRRSRISPPQSRFMNFPFSSGNTSHNTSSSEQLNKKSETSFFQQITSYLNKSNTKTNKIITSTTSSLSDFRKPASGMVYSSSIAAPRLNIGPFLDEHEPSTSVTQNQQTKKEKSHYFTNFLLLLLIGILSVPFIMFALQRFETNQDFTLNKALVNDLTAYLKRDIYQPVSEVSVNAWKNSQKLFTDLKSQGVQNLDLNWKKTKLDAGKLYKELSIFMVEAWEKYWPMACQMLHQTCVTTARIFFQLYEFVKETATSTTTNIVNTVEYKLPTFRHDTSETDADKKEIIQDYHLLKEKIFGEALEIVQKRANKADIDVQMIRNELDQKFNYTLAMMANKLVDQSMQFEISKANHERELKQMREILNELETRYSQSMAQLQEKLATQSHKLEEQEKIKQEKASDLKLDPKLEEDIKSLIMSSSEHISFQKIEEYINKTFYLYNADKTGMTDFASEAIGGSILFTRCTEAFTDNSRWFTIFDVPISRLTISPRVVIQGTVQPGNCWAFKGSRGDVFIKLAAKITPTSFSLEHIPKELSLTGVIDSAPQNFTVYGYQNKEDINDDNRLLIGNFRYDNNSKSTLQFFDAQKTYPDTPIHVIELKIESNAGNKDYTCLYKFRVHGKLFEQTLREKFDKEQTGQKETIPSQNDEITKSDE